MLQEVFAGARAKDQFSAAATAAMGIAKIHGLVIDTVNNVNERYVVGFDRQLTRIMHQGRGVSWRA